MYVERIANRNSPPAILLRESYRDGDKIRKRTLANLSDWPEAKIEAAPRAARRGRGGGRSRGVVDATQPAPWSCGGGAGERKLGLDRLLSQGGRQPELEVAPRVAMIVAR